MANPTNVCASNTSSFTIGLVYRLAMLYVEFVLLLSLMLCFPCCDYLTYMHLQSNLLTLFIYTRACLKAYNSSSFCLSTQIDLATTR